MADGELDELERLRRADFPVLRELPTRWSDDDVYGHVNNVVHYLMFDTAVNGWLIQASGTDIRRLPAIGVVVETSCRYLAQLRFPETVTCGIALARLGRSVSAGSLAGSARPPQTAAARSPHPRVAGPLRPPLRRRCRCSA